MKQENIERFLALLSVIKKEVVNIDDYHQTKNEHLTTRKLSDVIIAKDILMNLHELAIKKDVEHTELHGMLNMIIWLLDPTTDMAKKLDALFNDWLEEKIIKLEQMLNDKEFNVSC